MDLFSLQNTAQDLRGSLALARSDVQAMPLALGEACDQLWETISAALAEQRLKQQHLEGALAQQRLRGRSQHSAADAARPEGRTVRCRYAGGFDCRNSC